MPGVGTFSRRRLRGLSLIGCVLGPRDFECIGVCPGDAICGDVLKRPPTREKSRPQSRERLPTSNGHVDVARLELHGETDATGGLGSDQRSAASEEWLINGLPRAAVVLHPAPHGMYWLLPALR